MFEIMDLLVSLSELARFENSSDLETMGPYLVPSVLTQPLIEELEVREEPVKPDQTG